MKPETRSRTITDLVLARVAGRDVETLDGLLAVETRSVLERIDELSLQIANLQPRVMTSLYQLVPNSPSRQLTRYIINLQRDLHNNRRHPFHHDLCAEITDLLTDSDAADFSKLVTLLKEREAFSFSLNEINEREVKQIQSELMRNFDVEGGAHEFLLGLPVASLEFARSVVQDSRDKWNLGSNYSKTAFAYLQRGVMKTSPFSTLTQVCTTGFLTQDLPKDSEGSRIRVRWLRAIVTDVFEAIATNPPFCECFRFRCTENVELNGKQAMIRGKYLNSSGFFWKSEEVLTSNSWIRKLSELTKSHTDSFTLEELQTLLGMSNPTMLVQLLLTQRLVRPVAPYTQQEDRPFEQMARCLELSTRDPVVDLCRLLRLLEQQRAGYEACWTVQERIGILDEVKRCLRDLYKYLGKQIPGWLQSANVFYEDVRAQVHAPSLGPVVLEDLEQFYHGLSDYCYRPALYDELAKKFIENVGSGNRCNLMEFATAIVHAETEFQRMTGNARIRDAQGNPIRGASRVPVTTYFQLSAKSHQALLNGEYQLVINKVTAGKGTVFSRFSELLGPSYRDHLAEWIHSAFPKATPIEYSVGGDWSNLQEYFGILSERIRWVGEIPDKDYSQQTDIRTLSLTYDESTEEFNFLHPNGTRVLPVYLGTVPEHLASGLAKVVLTLASPVGFRAPFGIYPNPWERRMCPPDVTHHPRRMTGRVVLNRAEWVIPSEQLSFMREDLRPYELTRRFMALARKWEMPREMFIMPESQSGFLQLAKPFWFHIDSPHAMDFLKRSILKGASFIVFQEALPSRGTCWLRNEEARRVASEFMCIGMTGNQRGSHSGA